MPMTRSIKGLSDAVRVMDRALEEKGLALEFESKREASQFRQRCYSARCRDWDQARKSYEPGDPGYGTSPYDVLVMMIDQPGNKRGDKDALWVLKIMDATDLPPGAISIRSLATGEEVEI